MLVKRLTETAKLPTRANELDAGVDIYADEDVILYPLVPTKIRTGIAVQVPVDRFGKIEDKSSIGTKGIRVLGGVIDQGYTGEVIIVLINLTLREVLFRQGDKVAQMIVHVIQRLPIIEVDSLDVSERGNKGFGSSGAN